MLFKFSSSETVEWIRAFSQPGGGCWEGGRQHHLCPHRSHARDGDFAFCRGPQLCYMAEFTAGGLSDVHSAVNATQDERQCGISERSSVLRLSAGVQSPALAFRKLCVLRQVLSFSEPVSSSSTKIEMDIACTYNLSNC